MIRLLLLLGFFLVAVCQAEPALNYRTVEGADGVPLSVVTAGNATRPAIVFIHGIGQSHYMFHKQLQSGLTDDVAAVIAATQARRPVIVGWSYGTLVALDYVRHYGTSELVGVVLTGSVGTLRSFTDAKVNVPPITLTEDPEHMFATWSGRKLGSVAELPEEFMRRAEPEHAGLLAVDISAFDKLLPAALEIF